MDFAELERQERDEYRWNVDVYDESDEAMHPHGFTTYNTADERTVILTARGVLYENDWTQMPHAIYLMAPANRIFLIAFNWDGCVMPEAEWAKLVEQSNKSDAPA